MGPYLYSKWATVGLPGKRHLMAFLWLADDGTKNWHDFQVGGGGGFPPPLDPRMSCIQRSSLLEILQALLIPDALKLSLCNHPPFALPDNCSIIDLIRAPDDPSFWNELRRLRTLYGIPEGEIIYYLFAC